MAEFKKGDRVKVVKPGAVTFGKVGAVAEDASYLVLLEGETKPRKYAETSLDLAAVTPPPPVGAPKLVIVGDTGHVEGVDGQQVKFARAASAWSAPAGGYETQTAPGAYKGTSAEPYVDAQVGTIWLGRLPTSGAVPPPPPPPPSPPSGVAAKYGINARVWPDNDAAAFATLGMDGTHKNPIRFEVAPTNLDGLASLTQLYAGYGVPQPLITWDNIPSNAQLDALAAQLDSLTAVSLVECGNENAYFYKTGTNNTGWAAAYAQSVLYLAQKLKRVKVIFQFEDGGQTAAAGWLDTVANTAPQLGTLAGGVSVHSYGGDATWGWGRIARTISAAKARGWNLGVYVTESGTSVDPNGDVSGAAAGLSNDLDHEAAYPEVKQILLYETTDQDAPGSGRSEGYFGVTNAVGGAKGALTSLARTRLAS